MGVPEDNPAVGRLAEGNFQITMQVSQQRTIVVSGYLYADDKPAERNDRIDRAQDMLDRQFIRCDIINKRAQIKAQLAGIEQFRDQLADLQAIAEGKAVGLSANQPGKRPKLSSQQQMQLANGQATIEKAKKNIEHLEAEIAAAIAHIGAVTA